MRISDWSSDLCSSDLLGDQRDAVAGLHASGDQAIGGKQRIVAQFAIAVGAHETSARIVKIEPAAALRGIVERFADGGEVGEAARLRAFGGRGDESVRCAVVFFGHRSEERSVGTGWVSTGKSVWSAYH